MPGLPKDWDSLGTDQRRQWLKDRDLVLYGGHLIAAGYWAEHRAAITQEIDAKNVELLHRHLLARAAQKRGDADGGRDVP